MLSSQDSPGPQAACTLAWSATIWCRYQKKKCWCRNRWFWRASASAGPAQTRWVCSQTSNLYEQFVEFEENRDPRAPFLWIFWAIDSCYPGIDEKRFHFMRLHRCVLRRKSCPLLNLWPWILNLIRESVHILTRGHSYPLCYYGINKLSPELSVLHLLHLWISTY